MLPPRLSVFLRAYMHGLRRRPEIRILACACGLNHVEGLQLNVLQGGIRAIELRRLVLVVQSERRRSRTATESVVALAADRRDGGHARREGGLERADAVAGACRQSERSAPLLRGD